MTDSALTHLAQLRANDRLIERRLATIPPPPSTTGHGLQPVPRPMLRALLLGATAPPSDLPASPATAVYQHAPGATDAPRVDLEALVESLNTPSTPWFRVARWERQPWEGEFYADRHDPSLLVVVLPPTHVQVIADRHAIHRTDVHTAVLLDISAGPAVLSLPDGDHVVLERDDAAEVPRIAILSPTDEAACLPEPPLQTWLHDVADDPWLVARVNREAADGPWGRVLATAALWRLSRHTAEATRRAIRLFASRWTPPQSGLVMRLALDDVDRLGQTLQRLHERALADSRTQAQGSAARRDALEGVLVLLYAARHPPTRLHQGLAHIDALATAAILAFDDPDVLDPEHSGRTSLASPGMWWTGGLADGEANDDDDRDV